MAGPGFDQLEALKTDRSLLLAAAFSGANSTKVSARIITDCIINMAMQGPQSDLIPKIRQVYRVLHKRAGAEFPAMLESSREAHHALADAVFDLVTNQNRPETKERLRALPLPQRVLIESALEAMTGRLGRAEGGRWSQELWDIKTGLARLCDYSYSDVELKDIREGYHELVHAVVDELYGKVNLLLA